MEGGRQYEQVHPEFIWKNDEHSSVLELALPGFKKEQLKVQLDNHGNLRIIGERSKGGDKWARFKKEFPIPENAKTNEIRAKFENGKLFVTVPIRVTTTTTTTTIKQAHEAQQEEKAINGLGNDRDKRPDGLNGDKNREKIEAQREEKGPNGLYDDKSREKTEKEDGEPNGPGGAKVVESLSVRRPRKYALSAAVAALVVMGFGIYLAYNFWPKNGGIDHSENMLDV